MATEATHLAPMFVHHPRARAFPRPAHPRSRRDGCLHLTSLPMPSGIWKFNVDELTSTLPSVIHRGECGVCGDDVEGPAAFRPAACSHIFCKDCLRSYALVKLEERRYPIVCPACFLDRGSHNHIEDDLIEQLNIPPREKEILLELQLAQFSAVVHCPKCNQSMHVDREDYLHNQVITCPLSGCQHRWCTECRKEVDAKELRHHCKNKQLDKLMRRKGWRYCPGCRTPIQKESGCNHMSCVGCNVHFCYKCGDLIYDPAVASSSGTGLSPALTQHFRHCRQYERFRAVRALVTECTIM